MEGQPVGIVVVARRKEPIPARLLGQHDLAQIRIREMPVATEVDAADTGNRALVDLEDEIAPVMIELNALGIGGLGELHYAEVEIGVALPILLQPRAGRREERRVGRAGGGK